MSLWGSCMRVDMVAANSLRHGSSEPRPKLRARFFCRDDMRSLCSRAAIAVVPAYHRLLDSARFFIVGAALEV